MAYTFRDPNLAATFDVYAGMGEFLRTLEVDQSAVDPYILSCYSAYAMPIGQLNGAFRAMNRALEGKTDEEMLDYMRQIKALKAEDIAGLADIFDRWYEVGAHTTSGAQSAIEQDAALFDQVLMPLAEEALDAAA